ncbi:MAG: hypothetical protein ACTSRE_14935 [Promethearchaeota archaeon]
MHKKKLFIISLVAITCSTSVLLLMGIIPMFQGKEIIPYVEYYYKHYSDNGYYRLKVEGGYDYTLRLDFSNYDIRPEIQIFSHSFKTIGRTTEPNSPYSSRFLFEFHSNHNGHYYVSILDSKGGYFAIRLVRYNYASTDPLTNSYVNPWKLILSIFTWLLIISSLIIFIQLYQQKSEEKRIQKDFTKCPACGITCDVKAEYCDTCGHTFTKPKEYKNY